MGEKTKPTNKTISPASKTTKASFAALGTILIGLLTVAAGLFTTNNTLRINSLKQTLSTQIEKEKALNNAMVDIREFLLTEQDDCINGNYTGDKKQLRRNTISLIFKLIKENMECDEIFDHKILIKVQNFISVVYDHKNICANDFPKESTLIKVNREINLDMRKFTTQTEERIMELEPGLMYSLHPRLNTMPINAKFVTLFNLRSIMALSSSNISLYSSTVS